jgi:hypothetical protein
MSWLNHLVHIGIGLLEGYAMQRNHARHTPQHHGGRGLAQPLLGVPAASGHDFIGFVTSLARANGLPDPEARNDRVASLRVSLDEGEHFVLVGLGRGEVRVSAICNATFPDGTPGEVLAAVYQANDYLRGRGAALEVCEADGESYVTADRIVPAGRLDEDTFGETVRFLLAAAVAFERILRNNGLGRYLR